MHFFERYLAIKRVGTMISALLATLLAISERTASPIAATSLATAIRRLNSLDLHERLLP